VLYSDGTVGVGGVLYSDDDSQLDAYKPALKWENIKKLYLNQATLIGLCDDGTVKSVSPDWGDDFHPLQTKHLKNVVDVAYMEPDTSYFFLLEDGTVKCEREYYGNDKNFVPFDGIFKSWKNVKKLVPYYYYDIFAVFENGTVGSMAGYDIAEEQKGFWTDIQELYVDNRYYGVQKNGSVVIYDPYPDSSNYIPNEGLSLTGAKALYSAGDVMLGLNEDGELLVSGGKDWFQKKYGQKK
jgi:hypothetical protein